MATQSAERIKVFCRIRPSKENNKQSVLYINGNTAEIKLNENDETKSFQFDGLFDETATQDLVFERSASSIVAGTLQGYNGTIFAYGQTGSGKTHTMIGPPSKMDQNMGIIPRSLQLLFHELECKAEANPGAFSHTVTVSFIEIHNEFIYDLMACTDEKLKIGQDSDGNVIVKGATENFVKDVNDAMEIVRHGWKNRSVGETAMNRESSRSHALLMIRIRTEEAHGEISTARSAFLNLVDLAGSERVNQSKVVGDRFKELTNINKSLLHLKTVIRELSQQKDSNGFITFRNSSLTHILKDSLGGNARTAVMINVHPDKMYYSESLSTLNFSADVRTIENKVAANEDLRGESVTAYKVEIKRLQDEVENMKEQCSNELAAKQKELEEWKEKAIKYERQLAVAKRNAVNSAIVMRKEGNAVAVAEEESIWERTMEKVAESARKLPTTGIRSLQLRELNEQLELAIFEKTELEETIEVVRKEKAEIADRLKRYLDGAVSPRRGAAESSSSQDERHSGSQSSVLGMSMLTPAAKKERRRTRYTPARNRQSTFFRPVLDADDEEGGQPPIEPVPMPGAEEEKREMELELEISQKQQIIDEKMEECKRLEKLLADAEKRIADAEESHQAASARRAEEEAKNAQLADEMKKAEETITEGRLTIEELKKKGEELNGLLIEANAQVEILQSDAQLLRSTHADELKELEKRMRSNLSDKEKKEFDLIAEIDKLHKQLQSVNIDLTNKETEKKAAEDVCGLLRDRMLETSREKKEKEEEVESLLAQLSEMQQGWERRDRQMEEARRNSESESAMAMAELRSTLESREREMAEMRRRLDNGESESAAAIAELRSTLESREREMAEMRRKLENGCAETQQLESDLAALSIEKNEEMRRKTEEMQQDIEQWKSVSHQFSEKIEEMKIELSSEKAARMEAESREKIMVETLRVNREENEELKENMSALTSHANPKQKLHTFSRYVEAKKRGELRISQLEMLLQKHGITVPPGETSDDHYEGREGEYGDENALPNRRVTRAASSASMTAAIAANSKTSVRSSRAGPAAARK